MIFFSEALDRGASAAMVSNLSEIRKESVSEGRLVFVDDTMDGFKRIGSGSP